MSTITVRCRERACGRTFEAELVGLETAYRCPHCGTIHQAAQFRYCAVCAAALEWRDVGGERRQACSACGYIAFRNPAVGVAVVIRDPAGRVLLARRAARTGYSGMWCIPCGFVEWSEDLHEAARREAREETGLDVRIGDVVAVYSNFHNPVQHTVGVWFAAEVVGGELRPADDVDELAYVAPDADLAARGMELAFPTDTLVLEQLRQG